MSGIDLQHGFGAPLTAPHGPQAWRSTAAAADRMLTGEQRTFMDVIGRGGLSNGSGAVPPEAEARDAAEQLVAITFVQPILQQLRDSNDAAPPFAPTQGERQFRALLDAELAREIASAAQFPLVDRLARDLLRLPPEPAVTPQSMRIA